MSKDINQIAFRVVSKAIYVRKCKPQKPRLNKPGRVGHAPGIALSRTPAELREIAWEAFKDRLPAII